MRATSSRSIGPRPAGHLGARPHDARAHPHLLRRGALRSRTPRAAPAAGAARRSRASRRSIEFIARHREIVVGDGAVRLTGTGEGTLHVDSLEALAKTWSGEKYWYWARRVLRKLRHGIRRAHLQGAAFAGEGETPAVLLMEPQLADNVGMVARAMANFGLDDLRLIAPRDGWPNEKARIAASGANYIIDDARGLSDALERRSAISIGLRPPPRASAICASP